MQFLTDFADQAVVLPLVVMVALGLAVGGWRRGAIGWLVVAGVTLGVVGAAKLAVFVFGAPFGMTLLLSPSGHTASAPLVYGGLAMALLPGRLWGPAVAVAAVIAIGLTRVALGYHTAPDVWVGGGIGLAGTAAMWATLRARPAEFRRLATLGLVAAVLVGFHGLRLPAEGWLRAVAAVVRAGSW